MDVVWADTCEGPWRVGRICIIFCFFEIPNVSTILTDSYYSTNIIRAAAATTHTQSAIMHQRLSLPWLLGIFYSGGDTGGTGPMGGARVFCAIFYDFFFAAHVDRWRDELKNLRDEFARDVALMRERRSIMRERPEKGVMRPALFLLWLGLHMLST